MLRLTALAIGLAVVLHPAPARAERTLTGRPAQAIHCASMFLVGGAVLHLSGAISDQDWELTKLASAVMLSHVPGTLRQSARTAELYARKRYGSDAQLIETDFKKSRLWCLNTFVK
jgi:hypothetical protein